MRNKPSSTFSHIRRSLRLASRLFSSISGIITVQASLYFQRYPQDRIIIKALVGILW